MDWPLQAHGEGGSDVGKGLGLQMVYSHPNLGLGVAEAVEVLQPCYQVKADRASTLIGYSCSNLVNSKSIL